MSVEAPPAPPPTAPAAPPVVPPTPPAAPPAAPAPAPSGVQEVWAKDWIQPDFSLNHKALDRLPDHLKGLRPTLERQKSFEDVLVVMQNQQVLSGKKALAPLPADAPDNVKAERKQLIDQINGVPPTPKDYGIVKPKDIPDAQWSQPLADSFTTWAHKNSVSPAAAQELVGIQAGAVKEALQAQQQSEAQFYVNEQKSFDQALRVANIAADRAQTLVEKGAQDLGLDLQNPRTQAFFKGSDARLMALRHAISIGEDSVIQAPGAGGTGGDPATLANDAMHNKANPLYAQYWNAKGEFPRAVQEAAVARVNEWLRIAASKQPARTRR